MTDECDHQMRDGYCAVCGEAIDCAHEDRKMGGKCCYCGHPGYEPSDDYREFRDRSPFGRFG